jgi:hypothetical protein
MSLRRCLALCLALCGLAPLLLAAAADAGAAADAPTTKPHQHRSSADVTPGVTSLDLYVEQGRVHVLTATREPEQPARLFYQRWDDTAQRFTAPVPLGEGATAHHCQARHGRADRRPR